MLDDVAFFLDPAQVAATLPSTLDWEFIDQTGSTNADLLAQARQLAPTRARVRIARRQSAGRGRQGRQWLSEPGHCLTFSVVHPWPIALSASGGVGLSCGVALARTLHRHHIPVQLKWPNDLLLNQRKLAGLLIESTEDPAGQRSLVVGLGINLFLGSSQAAQIGQPAACLADVIAPPILQEQAGTWLARFVAALLGALDQYISLGFAPDRNDFLSYCAWLNDPISLQDNGTLVRSGWLHGVDDTGQLLMRLRDGSVSPVAAGDIRLRRATVVAEPNL